MKNPDFCVTVVDVALVEDRDEVNWQTLHDLLHRTYAYMDGRIDPRSSLHRLTVEGLQQKAADESLIVARDKGAIVGCMFCRREGDWLYVGKVAVDLSAQGQGVGRQMFNHAFDLARTLACRGLELETRVELLENHRTFARMGFVKVGEDAHQGFDQPTSIRMRATL